MSFLTLSLSKGEGKACYGTRQKTGAKISRGIGVSAYVYILRCRDGRYYVGSTRGDLEGRVGEHNSGVYGGAFFVLIGCHALHVASALVWVMVIWFRNRHPEACMTRSLGTSLCSLYWYYVVAVWPVLYAAVYVF